MLTKMLATNYKWSVQYGGTKTELYTKVRKEKCAQTLPLRAKLRECGKLYHFLPMEGAREFLI